MAKLTLDDVASLTNEETAKTTINNNSAAIEAAMEKTLSRDGTSPNTMSANLDMNSNRILNLPRPESLSEPLRLQELVDFAEAEGSIEFITQEITNEITNEYITNENNEYITNNYDLSGPEEAGIYNALNNSIANFVADGSTNNTTAWNTFMAAVRSGEVPGFSTLIFPRPTTGSSYYRFTSKPDQMASYLTIQGGGTGGAWFLRDYQPGSKLAVTDAVETTATGTTVSISGTITPTTVIAIHFATPSVTIQHTIQSDDTHATIAKYFVENINANATLTAAGITALNGYFNQEVFGIIHPSGNPTITETDPNSNIALSNPIRIETASHAISTGQVVGVYSVTGTTNANGMWYAGYTDSTGLCDLVGTTYNAAYVSGGFLLTDPLDPFIELGPQAADEEYGHGQQVKNILLYAGDETFGGIGLDVGSFVVDDPVPDLEGLGCSYRPIIEDIQTSFSGNGKWWVGVRIDGSASPGDTNRTFAGARNMVFSNLFLTASASLWCSLWGRSLASGSFTDLHHVGDTEIYAGIYLDGILIDYDDTVPYNNSYSIKMSGPACGMIKIGPYVNGCTFDFGSCSDTIRIVSSSGVSGIRAHFGSTVNTPVLGTATSCQAMANGNLYLGSGDTYTINNMSGNRMQISPTTTSILGNVQVGGTLEVNGASLNMIAASKLTAAAAVAANSGFRITPGAADPSSPAEGDMWVNGNALKIRLNGVTLTIADGSD